MIVLLIIHHLFAPVETCHSCIIITYRVKPRFMGRELLMLLKMVEAKIVSNNQVLSMILDLCCLLFNSFKIKSYDIYISYRCNIIVLIIILQLRSDLF